jgi:hypothetical protein
MDSYDVDTFRFDVNPIKLEIYKNKRVKKMTKKRFVTGITKDKVLQNIMNADDSDQEGRDKEGNNIEKDGEQQDQGVQGRQEKEEIGEHGSQGGD